MIRFALAALVAATGAPAAQPGLPPYAGLYQPSGVDERGLWMQADEAEREIRDSAFVIRDPALNAYLRQVLCRSVGPERCAAVRIYVVRIPAFNASMMPNGALQIWSGLLLRMRNEAELAAVLDHEFAHFERRHGMAGLKHARTMTDIASWAGVLGGTSALAVRRAAIGSVFTFDRAQETEADLLSARYVAASGYDAHCFADIWSRAMDEADATALGRRQRSRRYDGVAFFATHPTDRARADYLRAAADRDAGGDERGAARWAAAMAQWRAVFLQDQLNLNDFGGTEYLLGQLAADGWSEDLLFARAELYRARGNPRDLVAAADLYRQAVAIDPAHPDSWRGLGMALLRSGQPEPGRDALRRYLALRPAAEDQAIVTALLE